MSLKNNDYSAHAISKIILSGEHAVVHGSPAIALPVFDCCAYTQISQINYKGLLINAPQISEKFIIHEYKSICNPLELTVLSFLKKFDLDIPSIEINIKSDIPIASGMGSGAAISTSIIRCLCKYYNFNLSSEEIYDFVFEIEKIYHGNPSGIDPRVIVFESPFYFIKNKLIESISISINAKFDIIIIDSKIRSTTKEVVEWVGEQKNIYPQKYNQLFSDISEISNNLKIELNGDNIKNIGYLMTLNHRLLKEVGVSNSTLDEIVDLALECGSLGAKLSGAGKGGIVLALSEPDNTKNIIKNLTEKNLDNIIFTKFR